MKFTFNKVGVNLNWMQFDWISALKNEDLSVNDFKVYPVPADKFLNIEFAFPVSRGIIQTLSLDGRIVKQQMCRDSVDARIDVSDLRKGVYIVKADFGSGVYYKKVILD